MGHPVPASVPDHSNGNGQDVSAPVNSDAAKETTDKTGNVTDKPKKEKAKVHLVYNDNKVSPEEKMASLPRYAFVRDRTAQDTALAEVIPSSVVGTASDTPVDPSH